MLYLEDYLELIEHLPQELRDRFTEMREMDISIHNAMESQEEKMNTFFQNAKRKKPNERDSEFEALRQDCFKILEDAEEKVQLANSTHYIVDRYLRHLDQDLHKFKMELEADNMGVTEILEKRSLELDHNVNGTRDKENRHGTATRSQELKTGTPASNTEKKDNVYDTRQASSSHAAATSTSSNPPSSAQGLNYNSLGYMGAGGNAIAAAASQAIAATKQMHQGRRTSSLKASYEAINMGVHAQEFSIVRDLAGTGATTTVSTSGSLASTASGTSSGGGTLPIRDSDVAVDRKYKMKKRGQSVALPPPAPSPPSPGEASDNPSSVKNVNPEIADWTYDPDEPRYCICNQVSYGDMVACDNAGCPVEWFHYQCVQITAPPKGKWYCPQCTQTMKRRGSRKTN